MAPVDTLIYPSGVSSSSPSYIVESAIQCEAASFDEPFFGRPLVVPQRLDWGFVVTVWNPGHPEVVREFHWNTPEERARQAGTPGEIGRIVERVATEREKREGLRQHEEALARG